MKLIINKASKAIQIFASHLQLVPDLLPKNKRNGKLVYCFFYELTERRPLI